MKKIDKAIEANKDFLFICADYGAATVIGADEDWDEYDGEKCYMMYAGDFSPYKSKEITEETFSGNEKERAISEIYYSHGLKVIMKNKEKRDDFPNRSVEMKRKDGAKITNLEKTCN